jgi:hypothetical protein
VARSRYEQTPVIDGVLGSWRMPLRSGGLAGLDIFEGIPVVEHTLRAGQRLDHLAELYCGDGDLGWLIEIGNGLGWSLDLQPGTRLRVPRDAESARRALERLLP